MKGDWKYYLDPVMSLCIAAIIVCTTIPLLKQTSLILLQNPPGNVKPAEIVANIKKVCFFPGVLLQKCNLVLYRAVYILINNIL